MAQSEKCLKAQIPAPTLKTNKQKTVLWCDSKTVDLTQSTKECPRLADRSFRACILLTAFRTLLKSINSVCYKSINLNKNNKI